MPRGSFDPPGHRLIGRGEGSAMERRLELEGGGEVTLVPEGLRVSFSALREEDGRGVYKVWLRGEGKGSMLLGTLAPQNGRLELKRNISLGELERSGCWPVAGARAVLAVPFAGEERWYCEGRPERLVKDPVVRGQLRGPMLCRREGEGFSLAAPFRTDAPVVLNALFCLARAERLEGRLHLVWSFDSGGLPRLPREDAAKM